MKLLESKIAKLMAYGSYAAILLIWYIAVFKCHFISYWFLKSFSFADWIFIDIFHLNYNVGIGFIWGLLAVVLSLILMAAGFLGLISIPPIIGCNLHNQFIRISMNCNCAYLYEKEEIEGIPHVERETGDEWYTRIKKEAREAEEERKAREEAEKKAKEYNNKHQYDNYNYYENYNNNYNYQKNYNQGQDYSDNSGYNNNSRMQNSELKEAMDAFLMDEEDLNAATEEQLKQIRNRLIKGFHPDGNDDALATKQAQKINAYYKVLLDAVKRG